MMSMSLRETIKYTLKEAHPAQYRRMASNGELEPYLQSLIGQYHESVSEGRQAVLNQMADGLVQASDLPMIFLEIESEALNQMAEQVNSLQTTESDPES